MSNVKERKPWDRLPDEPETPYVRFLIYRNLGPGRSLLAAYRAVMGASVEASERVESLRVSGQWSADSSRFKWVERATAWDVSNLRGDGEIIVISYIRCIRMLAEKALLALAREDVKPNDWSAVLSTIDTLTALIPPEAIARLSGSARAGGPGGLPGDPGLLDAAARDAAGEGHSQAVDPEDEQRRGAGPGDAELPGLA